MGNSLRDQFLKAGLVTEKQAKQAKKQQYDNKAKSQGKKPTVDDNKRAAAAAAAQKAERDRLLNAQRKEAADRKSIAAQVRQLIENNRQPRGGDDIAFNFSHGNVVKRIYVSEDVRTRIVTGTLAIVALDEAYELVSREIAEKIRLRDAAAVVVQNQPGTAAPDGDDPYADYQVPDDLTW